MMVLIWNLKTCSTTAPQKCQVILFPIEWRVMISRNRNTMNLEQLSLHLTGGSQTQTHQTKCLRATWFCGDLGSPHELGPSQHKGSTLPSIGKMHFQGRRFKGFRMGRVQNLKAHLVSVRLITQLQFTPLFKPLRTKNENNQYPVS